MPLSKATFSTEKIYARCRNFKSLQDVIEGLSSESHRGIAFVKGGRNNHFIAYGQLYDQALNLLGALQSQGVQRGDEIIFQVAEEETFVTLFWACILGGLTAVPVTLGFHEEIRHKLTKILHELRSPYLFTDCEGLASLQKLFREAGYNELMAFLGDRALVYEPLLARAVPGKRVPVGADDLAFVQYSSGSTGSPKGIMLSHKNLLTNIGAMIKGSAMNGGDITCSWMPLTHDMGLIGFHLTPLVAVLDQIIIPPARFLRNPLMWMEVTSWKKVTIISSPNFGFHYFLKAFRRKETQSWDLSRVRLIFNGAEPISVRLCREFLETMAPYGLGRETMFPVYGLAEASLAVSFPVAGSRLEAYLLDGTGPPVLCPPDEQGWPTIDEKGSGGYHVVVGRPVEHCEVAVRDEQGGFLPALQVGEIYIRGDNVTRGFYQKSTDGEGLLDESGWLKTGDLGFTDQGRLVITGRAKDVFFKNGQNFYAHDVEALVERLDGVSKCAVVCVYKKDGKTNQVLVFVQFRRALEVFAPLLIAIKNFLSRKVGLNISAVLPIPKLPRTTSGKLKRFKLEEQFNQGAFDQTIAELKTHVSRYLGSRQVRLPTDPTMVAIAEIWRELLDVHPIGMDDHFFELGGDSLRASELSVRLRMRLNARLSLRDIFMNARLSDMAVVAREKEASVAEFIKPAPDQALYPLTSEQARLYFLHCMEPGSVAYNNCRVFEIKGPLETQTLQRALDQLVGRHTILRSAFVVEDGEAVVKILDEVQADLVETDAEEPNLANRLKALILPFDLAKPPLFRAALIRVAEERYILFLDIHHIICDGTSLGMLLNEWFRLFGGATPAMPEVQYKDYSIWQQSYLKTPETENHKNYWLEKLSGELTRLSLPTDKPRKNALTSVGGRVELALNQSLTAALQMLALRYQVTVSMVLLTVFKVLLAKYTGQEEVLVGTVMAGRNHPGQEHMLGMFVKTVVLRTAVADRLSFEELLSDIKGQFLDGYEHQDYPFERIVEALGQAAEPGRNPIFDVAFVFQNFRVSRLWPKGLNVELYPFFTSVTKFDLTLEVNEKPNLVCLFDYKSTLFYRSTIRHMADHFHYLVSQIAAESSITVGDLFVLPAQEAWLISREFYGKDEPYPEGQSLDRIFERRAAISADLVMAYEGERAYTYEEINHMVNQLARYLRKKGVGLESMVGLISSRSVWVPVAILAIWKAGGAYVPVDPEFPAARKRYYLEHAGAGLILSAVGEQGLGDLAEVLPLGPTGPWSDESTDNPDWPGLAGSLAYMIFTSGSTGMPKGAMVAKEQVMHMIYFMQSRFSMEAGDIHLVKSPPCFDFSLSEMFLATFSGAAVCIAPPGMEKDPQSLAELIIERGVTHTNFIPSSLKLLIEALEKLPPSSLKYIRSGGERLDRTLVQRINTLLPECKIANMYGPTETTICAAFCRLEEVNPKRDPPIGLPIPNYRIYILNHRGQPQPIGVIGEINIGGIGVARGYHSKRLTAQRFVPNPFQRGARMYRSGDLGRWLPDGRIEFRGRMDHQVKIRGYRIELGEIEYHLRMHDAVRDAVVVVQKVAARNFLCAYFVADGSVTATDLRDHLTTLVAEYMVPSHYIELERMPLTPNGKADLKRLPMPGDANLIRAQYEPPRNRLEEKVAQVWGQLLGLEKVGRYDHFFELGGHSLMATKAVGAVSEYLHMKLPVRILFESPRVNEFATRASAEKTRAKMSRDWEIHLATLRRRLQQPLDAIHVILGDRTWRIWYVDLGEREVRVALYQEGLHEMMPDYLQPRSRLERTADFRDTEQSPEAFRQLLGLETIEPDLASFAERYGSRVIGFRKQLNYHYRFQREVAKYPSGHHPGWFVKRGVRSVLFGEFCIEHGVAPSCLLAAINTFIEKQPLLHSHLIRHGEDFFFSELATRNLTELDILDLQHISPACRNSCLTHLRALMREDLENADPLNGLLYNLVVVRLNFSEYRLVFAYDHIIGDYDSARVLRYHFNPLNGAMDASGKWPIPDYPVVPYAQFLALSHIGSDDDRIETYKASSAFRAYRDLCIQLRTKYERDQEIVFSPPVHVVFKPRDQQGGEAPNFHGYSMTLTVFVLARLFKLEKVPLRVLVNRRIFRGVSFYNTIADFHDSIPVVLRAGGLTRLSCYHEFRLLEQLYADKGYHLSSLGEDRDVYQAVFKSPFNLNYVGEISAEQEREVLARAQAFSFVSYPVYAYSREGRLGLVLFHGMPPEVITQLNAFCLELGGTCEIGPVQPVLG